MTRQWLDEYLDGALSPAQAAQVEAALHDDAQAAALLERIKQERALRSAAMATYRPASNEATAAAARVMELLRAETPSIAGRIGPWTWVRRLTATAAVLALIAEAFIAGQRSTPTTVVMVPEPAPTVYTVVYKDSAGEQQTKKFADVLEAQSFIDQLHTSTAGQAVASLDGPGVF